MMPDKRDAVDAIAQGLLGRGTRRIILLGTHETAGDRELKRTLARRGLMVLAPPPSVQAWLDDALGNITAGESVDATTAATFATFLADGLEHGVDTVVGTHGGIRALVEASALDVHYVDATVAMA